MSSSRDHELIKKARVFAMKAHGGIGQKRKYSGKPYIVHPAAVASKVAQVTQDPRLIAAAWLHDTVEDTPVTQEQICEVFGEEVGSLVEELTDVSTLKDGNRKTRREKDRQHTAKASSGAKTVKLADLIHNANSIIEAQAKDGFAFVFIPEMKRMLGVLNEGDPVLFKEASRIVQDFEDEWGEGKA